MNFKKIFSFLFLPFLFSCGSEAPNVSTIEKNRILNVFPIFKSEAKDSILRKSIIIVNSIKDFEKTDIYQSHFYSFPSIDFIKYSLLIIPSYVDYKIIERKYSFYKNREGGYIVVVDYIVEDTKPLSTQLEYLSILVPKVPMNSNIFFQSSYLFRRK